jgi:hypothetical protein
MTVAPNRHRKTKKKALNFIDLSCRKKSDSGVKAETGYSYAQVNSYHMHLHL